MSHNSTRRQWLALLGLTVTSAFAGCIGDGEDDIALFWSDVDFELGADWEVIWE